MRPDLPADQVKSYFLWLAQIDLSVLLPSDCLDSSAHRLTKPSLIALDLLANLTFPVNGGTPQMRTDSGCPEQLYKVTAISTTSERQAQLGQRMEKEYTSYSRGYTRI